MIQHIENHADVLECKMYSETDSKNEILLNWDRKTHFFF